MLHPAQKREPDKGLGCGRLNASCISPTVTPTFGGDACPRHQSPLQVPGSPTHDPAVRPGVHLAGEEQSVAPQVVLHGPLQGFLKTKHHIWCCVTRLPLRQEPVTVLRCRCPMSNRDGASTKTLRAPPVGTKQESWEMGFHRHVFLSCPFLQP